MPFGIATAPEEYQHRQHEALEGLPGIYVIADDILITGQGETREEALQDHDKQLNCIIEESQGSQLEAEPQEAEAQTTGSPLHRPPVNFKWSQA